jgi:hypothetical protein
MTFVCTVTLSFAKKEMGMPERAIKAVLQMQTFIKKNVLLNHLCSSDCGHVRVMGILRASETHYSQLPLL